MRNWGWWFFFVDEGWCCFNFTVPCFWQRHIVWTSAVEHTDIMEYFILILVLNLFCFFLPRNKGWIYAIYLVHIFCSGTCIFLQLGQMEPLNWHMHGMEKDAAHKLTNETFKLAYIYTCDQSCAYLLPVAHVRELSI